MESREASYRVASAASALTQVVFCQIIPPLPNIKEKYQ
jgi:hypothetical protein